MVGLWMMVASALAAPGVDDDVLLSLAAGDPRSALGGLQRALRGAADPEELAQLRCMLGRAQQQAGRLPDAIETLSAVPLSAGCGPQAAFGRADALVQLGRAQDGAALYATLGAPALEDGALSVLVLLEERVDAALAQVPPRYDHAETLLIAGLQASVPLSDRLGLARRLGEVYAAQERTSWSVGPMTAVLRDAAGQGLADASDLLLLASSLPPSEGWRLVSTLGAEGPASLTRARVGMQLDRELGLSLWSSLLRAGSADALRDERLSVGQTLLSAGRVEEASALLAPLLAGTDSASSAAQWSLARARLARGELPEAIEAMETYLSRFPSQRERSSVEQALSGAQLRLGRERYASGDLAGAVAAYDALVSRDPTASSSPEASYEAALVAREQGEVADFLRRLREIRARWPQSSAASRAVRAEARHIAFDEDKLEAARAFLRAEDSGVAQSELSRLEGVRIQARTEPAARPRDASVEVITRNLSSVEVRLHRIDAEAFLRAGGRPGTLPDLDVAVIAPDATFEAEIPEHAPGRDVVTRIPLRGVQPGLYAVTVASPDREARTLLSVGGVSVLARAAGPDLAVGVLRGDRPAGGARVLVSTASGVQEVRADRHGLATLEVPAGEVVIVAESSGGVGLLSLSRGGSPVDAAPHTVSLDTDRAIYRPGDTVGARVVGRQQGAPLRGTWRLWLEINGARVSESVHTADDRGAVVAELPLPATRAYPRAVLMGLPPGADTPTALATLPVSAAVAVQHQVHTRVSGTEGTITVTDARGVPAAGVPIRWQTDVGMEGVGVTDSRGALSVTGPPGLRWSLTGALVTDIEQATARATEPDAARQVWLEQDHLRPQEAGRLQVRAAHASRATLVLSERLSPAASPKAPQDPWVPSFDTGLESVETWSGDAPELPGAGGLRPVWTGAVEVAAEGEVSVALPALAAGRYQLRAVWEDGQTTWVPLTVSADGLRLVGPRPAAVGETVRLTAEGAPALVTAETDGIVAAAMLRPGDALPVPVTSRWGETARWIATGADGVHARALPIEDALTVSVERTVLPDGRWSISASVRDGAGRPVSAQVALRMVDQAIGQTYGTPQTLRADVLQVARLQAAALGGRALPLRHAADASLLSAALLEEAARTAAAERASQADQGVFEGRLLDALNEEIPFANQIGGMGGANGLGGLGTHGYGRGSSGYGSGGGSFGRSRAVRGIRERVLWRVLDTDRQGIASAVVDAPTQGAVWTVTASALADDAVGVGSLVVDDTERIWATVPTLGAASPGDSAEPRVTVVNGTEAAQECAAGDARATVGAGEVATLPLGRLSAGASMAVSVQCDGASVLDASLSLPLAPVPGVWSAAAGPDGRLPLARLALADDPIQAVDVVRLATGGRAALAALPWAAPSERPALEAQIASVDRALQVQVLGLRGVQAVTEVLAFYAEAGERARLLTAQQEHLLSALPAEGSFAQRVRQARLRIVLGAAVDPALLDALARAGASRPADDRARLARLLVAAGRADDAGALVEGDGIQVVLARRALGLEARPWQDALLAEGPPPTGDPRLPDWIAAVGGVSVLPRGSSVDALLLGGEVFRWAGGPGRLSGAAPLTWEYTPPPEPAPAPVLARGAAGLDGVPLSVSVAPHRDDFVSCGDPCVIAVGDTVQVGGALDAPGWSPPGGLRWHGEPGSSTLLAHTPGEYTLSGVLVRDTDGSRRVGQPVSVRVLAEEGRSAPIGAEVAVPLAAQHARAEQWAQSVALLGDRPAVEWSGQHAPTVASLHLQAALASGEAEAIVQRFEDLRSVAPSTSLRLAEVAAVARAYADVGLHERSTDVWRAGLGAAFLAEAAVARQVEQAMGLLSSLKIMRQLTQQYPDVPLVEEARFLLPQRVAEVADGPLPQDVDALGIEEVDLRLTAAAWDREFLARYPDSVHHAESGFHLVENLLRLKAYRRGAAWAQMLARKHERSPLLDGLLYMEGIAAAEQGEDRRALRRFEQVASGLFVNAAGQEVPAESRTAARYAAARLRESQGDLSGAREGYAAVADARPEARQALWALSRVLLAPEPLVVAGPGSTQRLPTVAANLSEVDIRIYRLDLRTIFLRDGGLAGVQDIAVAGVSPTWSGQRTLDTDPHPTEVALSLPISGPGAWLVQLSGGGQEASSLVVVSALDLRVDDLSDHRRLSVRRGGAPAAGVSVRAVSGGQITATQTDLRGIASVPRGAAVLVVDGEDYAFSAQPLAASSGPSVSRPLRPAPDGGLLDGIQDRSRKQRSSNRQSYEQIYDLEASEEINVDAL